MLRIGLARGLLALLLLPGISHALGLGDVRLNSPLNAPLDAEIELVNATPEDLATLEAKLASKETFARYGLDWPPFMSSGHGDARSFRERRAGAAHQVHRNRHRTVPHAAHRSDLGAWPPGARIHRAARSAGVCAQQRGRRVRQAMPAVGGAASIAARFPVLRQTEAPSAARPVAAGGGDSYEVQRGDSLSAIARRLSASTGARTAQLMVSIYRGNCRRLRRRHESPARGLGAAHSRRRRNRRGVAVRGERRSPPPRRLLVPRRVGAASGGRLRLVPPERLRVEPRRVGRQLRRGRSAAGSRARTRRPAHRIQAPARTAQYRTCRPAGEAGRFAAAAARRAASAGRDAGRAARRRSPSLPCRRRKHTPKPQRRAGTGSETPPAATPAEPRPTPAQPETPAERKAFAGR